MKKISLLIVCIGLTLLFFTACDGDQTYRQYKEAYQKLWKADSFVVERSGTLTTSENPSGTDDDISIATEESWQMVHKDEGGMAIANVVTNTTDDVSTMLNIYYRDGYLYSQNTTNPEENYRCRREEDYVMKMATGGIVDFPSTVIVKQNVEDTAEGQLLTFELDSEKYYAYRFPETYGEYHYGVSPYSKPPVYTVLLDQQGRIKQVTGHFCTVDPKGTGFTQDQSYTITFKQYGDVKLAFPQLNTVDYPESGDGQLAE